MKLAEVMDCVGSVPHMSPAQGTIIYNMIIDNDFENIIELGTSHGTGSCYMAAALQEKGKGTLTTIDREKALERQPNLHDQLKKCGLTDFVKPIFAPTTYNWELMKMIEKQTNSEGVCEPLFDFCYLDGSHNFQIDSAAFFLVDKLMKPGSYILFDDLNWTYASSPTMKDVDWVKEMSEEERTTPHIKKLVEVLVMPHPNYHNFNVQNQWFLAQKRLLNGTQIKHPIDLEMYRTDLSFKKDVKKVLKGLKNRALLKLRMK